MVRLHPFAALRPRAELVHRVAAVPYDVVDRAEAKALAAGEPLSFLHVSRSEIDMPDDVDPHAPEVYTRAAEVFARFGRDGVFEREAAPALYLYRQEATLLGGLVSQTGVFGCCHVDDYRGGIIKRHELTRRDKEDDRTKHIVSIGAHPGPVFLAHRKDPALAARVAEGTREKPLYDFVASDGVRHVVWRIADPQPFVDAFAKLDAAYIADGHHRAASAARAADAVREKRGAAADPESQWFACVLFASDELHVLPYHRVVRDLPAGLDARALRERLAGVGTFAEASDPNRLSPTQIGVFLDGRWHALTLGDVPDPAVDPVRALLYVQLTERVLTPILGIADLRTDARIDFVGGIRGTQALEERVRSGKAAVAFAMPAVAVEQIMHVADAGAIMPPKSTWFEPKLRSGLLIHTFET